jgi:curved DNA-binding protein CbpA
MTVPDLYQVLDVSHDASTAAINAAYRRKAKTLHPDAGGDAEDFRILKLARDVLADPNHRKDFDRTGDLPDVHREENAQAMAYAAAGDLLLSLVGEIKSPNYEDVLAILRDVVTKRLRQTAEQQASVEKLLEKLPVVANRLRPKEGENILRSVLLRRGEDLRKTLDSLKHDTEINERILRLLDNYEYFVQIENVLISNDVWTGR